MQATYWLEFLAVPWLAFFFFAEFFSSYFSSPQMCHSKEIQHFEHNLLKLTASQILLRNISYVSKVITNNTTIFFFFPPF